MIFLFLCVVEDGEGNLVVPIFFLFLTSYLPPTLLQLSIIQI